MNPIAQQITRHHAAAQNALGSGKLRDAHQHCLAILKLDETFADAWFLCGVIAAHNGALEKAVEILRKAIGLAPANAEYAAEIAKQLVALRQPNQALIEARNAATLAPSQIPTLNTLGTVFSHCGEHEQALECFNKAIAGLNSKHATQLPPKWQAELHCNAAASMQFSGDFLSAEAAYEKAIEILPNQFNAHWALAALRRQTIENNHIDRLQRLRDQIATPKDQLHLGHAIAKEQEDLGNYHQSLESLAWAKQAHSQDLGYNAEADAEIFRSITELFDGAFIENQRSLSAGSDSREPIFIVGMPRTGTTLVEQILSSHSQVFAAGELQNFPLQVKRMAATPSPSDLDEETLQAARKLSMQKLGDAYLDSTRPRTGHCLHFIDKLPLNFLYIGLIKLALPNAKIVCLRRDPMDTCLSNYRQLLTTNSRHYLYNLDLLDCGRYYIQFNALMRHWHQVLPGSIYELQYEDLVSKPENLTRELLQFCEVPWEDQCLSFHQQSTAVATPSAVQVRQGIYTSSVNRWQRYGDALQPLYELLRSAGVYS